MVELVWAPLLRLTACALVLPLGWQVWAIGLRVLGVVVLAPLAARIPTDSAARLGSESFPLAVLGEIALGLCLGCVITSISIVASLVARIAVGGLTTADEDSSSEGCPLRAILWLVAIAFFFVIHGDRIVLDHVLSFHREAVAGDNAHQQLGFVVVEILSATFRCGLGVAVPILATTLFANVVVGLLGQSLPALFAPGMTLSLQWLIAAFGLFLMLSAVGLLYADGAAQWLRDVFAALSQLTGESKELLP